MARPDTTERFWTKVDFNGSLPEHRPELGPCWAWTAGIDRYGYGYFRFKGRQIGSHRYAYESCVGPIPKELQIDHLCRNRLCVNFDHMELVTSRENTIRGVGIASKNAKKSYCVQGHPFDEENTELRKSGGRRCRTCQRKHVKNHKRQQLLQREPEKVTQ